MRSPTFRDPLNSMVAPGSAEPLESAAVIPSMAAPFSSIAVIGRWTFSATACPRFRSVPRTMRLSPFFSCV